MKTTILKKQGTKKDGQKQLVETIDQYNNKSYSIMVVDYDTEKVLKTCFDLEEAEKEFN